MKVLVVAAHPDDEVLGCGGTIARLARDGHEVHIAIVGEGITSRYRSREEAPLEEIRSLHQQAQVAAQILGARNVIQYALPDNRLDTVPLLDVVKIIEDVIQSLRPDVVYTHHGGDLNLDHALLHRACLVATRPAAESTVRAVYAYEVPSSTDWAFQQFEPVFRPNFFVDISSVLQIKIEAMKAYASELRRFPHPRSLETIRASAERWGSVAGLAAAEAFHVVRIIDFGG